MTKKVALITGVTGQDGSYLAEFLLEKGYEVHGIKRRSSSLNTERIDHIYQDLHSASPSFFLHYGDLSDTSNLTRLLSKIQPDEVYNLGAQSHVAVSFECPEYTADVDGLGTLRLLEAIRFLGLEKKTRFIKRLLQNFMVTLEKLRRRKLRHFILALLMVWQKCMLTGWLLITVKLTVCMQATVFYLIMNPPVVVKLLLPVK